MRSRLTLGNITTLPLVHGRLPFAMDARRTLLGQRYDVLAVELPLSLQDAVLRAIDELPRISVVTYREKPAFLDPDNQHVWYVPIDPCDGIVEALRIAGRERTRIEFIDAEVEEFQPRPVNLPDAHAITPLGLEQWYRLVSSHDKGRPRTEQDRVREAHMAAHLAKLAEQIGEERQILFICGLAHWKHIREHLENGTGGLHPGCGPDPSLVAIEPVHPRSLIHVLGETPHLTGLWEEHRGSWVPGSFEPVVALKKLLLDTRARYQEEYPEHLEKATPQGLRTLLIYLRKLVVSAGRLMPDTWSLAVAARGTIGNDFAVSLVKATRTYPPNEGLDDVDPIQGFLTFFIGQHRGVFDKQDGFLRGVRTRLSNFRFFRNPFHHRAQSF